MDELDRVKKFVPVPGDLMYVPDCLMRPMLGDVLDSGLALKDDNGESLRLEVGDIVTVLENRRGVHSGDVIVLSRFGVGYVWLGSLECC